MFLLDSGLLGLRPYIGREGDMIVLVRGIRSPLILRPYGKVWTFTGLAYVHGIMYNELATALEGMEVKLEGFTLSLIHI